MGGATRVLDMAEESCAAGDFRWVAEVVNSVVQAEPDDERARLLQAAALEQLGYGAERDRYHTALSRGALVHGRTNPVPGSETDLVLALDRDTLNRIVASPGDAAGLLDSGALRCDGYRSALTTLVGLLERPRRNFPVVTPSAGP
ncbi:hypothetical protein GCM10027174_15720 [Salinifilum aidingensis]